MAGFLRGFAWRWHVPVQKKVVQTRQVVNSNVLLTTGHFHDSADGRDMDWSTLKSVSES